MSTVKTTPAKKSNIIDVDLSVTERKLFRFDGDDNRTVAINVSDIGIINRLSEVFPKLDECKDRAVKLLDSVNLDDEENLLEGVKTAGQVLKDIDEEMRDLIDFLFNAPVSAAAAPDGSMYDPFDGSYRFEHIIYTLMTQFSTNLQYEYSKMVKQVEKHTAKYTNKKKGKK